MAITNAGGTPPIYRDLWKTDPRVVRWIEGMLGVKFDLDVCGDPYDKKRAPKVCIKDPRVVLDMPALEKLGFYWDGLAQPWHKMGETGFMNMPFQTKAQWIAKAERESRLGMLIAGISPVAMAAGWFRGMEQGVTYIKVPDRRINFINPMTMQIMKGVNFETVIPIWEERKSIRFERVVVRL